MKCVCVWEGKGKLITSGREGEGRKAYNQGGEGGEGRFITRSLR